MRTDFLIVGQGLAGSILAWELLRRQYKVLVVDAGLESASEIAAGIINPITGQRFVKSAQTDQLLSNALACYAALGQSLGGQFFSAQPMLRILQSASEVSAFAKRFSQLDYQAYLANPPIINRVNLPFQSVFGCIVQQQTGTLNTLSLLQHIRRLLHRQDAYRQCDFHYADLKLTPKIQWQDISPRCVIFCEGYRMRENPWFNWLPLQAVKGEIITLELTEAIAPVICNYGDWLVPVSKQRCRVGATFDRDAKDTLPTLEGERQLRQNLRAVAPTIAQGRKVAHHANFRPCTPDRQPFLGLHPQYPQLAIFNGFGAKGSLLIPWFSQHFADALISGKAIEQQVSIARFLQYYQC